MKILQVSTVASTINAFLLPYAREVRKLGWRIDAAAQGIHGYKSILDTHDFVFDISFSRNPFDFKSIYRSLFSLRELVKTNGYNIVHVHTPIAAFITRLSLVGISTRVLYTAHGFHYQKEAPLLRRLIYLWPEKIAGYFTDHLFVINKDDYDFATRWSIVSKEKLTFLNGVGVKQANYELNLEARKLVRGYLGVSESTFILIHIAELNKNKNHSIILQALQNILKKDASLDIKYVMAGVGPNADIIKEEVQNRGLSEYVIILGYVNNVNDYLSASDCLCLSSFREGLPRCILEAMSVPIPVIASDIRGCRDLLSYDNGILVSPIEANTWEAAILKLYFDPQLRSAMSVESAQIVNELFSEEKVVSKVLDVYKKIAD